LAASELVRWPIRRKIKKSEGKKHAQKTDGDIQMASTQTERQVD
jgi:hypothetical protein